MRRIRSFVRKTILQKKAAAAAGIKYMNQFTVHRKVKEGRRFSISKAK